MVLEDGSFHADPHPGNIIYLRDGRIGVIDFGMVGALSEVRRFQRATAARLVEQDPQGVADVLLDWAGGVEWTRTAAARHQPVRRPVPGAAEGPASA
jgi:ubiquinone biosynthesis protein